MSPLIIQNDFGFLPQPQRLSCGRISRNLVITSFRRLKGLIGER